VAETPHEEKLLYLFGLLLQAAGVEQTCSEPNPPPPKKLEFLKCMKT
jgi:hypothetical protein